MAISKAEIIVPYVKDAYLKWTYKGKQQLTLGIQPTLTFDWLEGFWGLRHIEKTPADLYRLDSSRDFGFSFDGPARIRGLSYAAQFGNESGSGSETQEGKIVRFQTRYEPASGDRRRRLLQLRKAAVRPESSDGAGLRRIPEQHRACRPAVPVAASACPVRTPLPIRPSPSGRGSLVWDVVPKKGDLFIRADSRQGSSRRRRDRAAGRGRHRLLAPEQSITVRDVDCWRRVVRAPGGSLQPESRGREVRARPRPGAVSGKTTGLDSAVHVLLDVLKEVHDEFVRAGCAGFPGCRRSARYEPSWLRHDIVAGLVMTTMLVPVGIAYAEASGLPGINGLYATIVPLLAYAVFGPSRILVLGPDSALAAVILAVVLPLSAGDPQRARRRGRNDGHRVRHRVRGGRPGAPRIHHRAALQADPLRLHERHRADRDPEPDSEAPRIFRQRGWTAAPGVGDRREGVGRQHQRHGARDRRRRARADSRAEAVAAHSGHAGRGRRRHDRGRRVRSRRTHRASPCSVRCRRACRCRAFRWCPPTASARS